MRRGTTVPPERANAPHFVYTVWQDRTPLYVGCTNNVERRMKEHRSFDRWAGVEVRVEVFEFPDMLTALDVESHRIWKLRPAGNLRDNPAHTDLLDVMYEDTYPAWLLDRLVEDRRRIHAERQRDWHEKWLARNGGAA